MNLGAAIRELRKSEGLTQGELATKAKITQTTLSKIETGTGKRPNDTTLESIAKALGVPVSLIFVMGIEKGDVPPKKRDIYERMFPVIKTMIMQIAGDD